MLTSQKSSNLSNSSSVLARREVEISSGYPEKFKKSCLFSRKVFFDSDDCVTLLVTSLFELIECKDDEIVNCINLKGLCDLKEITSKDIQFKVIVKENGAIYALKIHSVLFGIERSSSQLKLLKTLTNVYSFKCQFDESFELVFQVTFDDESRLLTSFQDDDLEDFMNNKESETFADVYEKTRQISKTAATYLNTLTRNIEEMSLVLYGQTKTMPKLMLEDVSCKLSRR